MQNPGYKPPIPSVYDQPPHYSHLSANTSGQGASATVPPEVAAMGFSWGAFGLTAFWGIFNSVWIALLVWLTGIFKAVPLLPLVVGIGFKIYMGINGHEMAWRSRRFDSIEHFCAVQEKWNRWGTLFFAATLIIVSLAVIALVALS